ncbi:coagulation factor X-activating enzyme heavy chain-like [Ixodes scapularis]|uniref:coagulation factor X-activating enzyme heavy chain-like n=1 Tax=Ixodes scapularis TaxID=6945 RepID=UPI001A9EBF2C|nr:coagulation factor X-activating enzyme heavy chain-like [Ixodes scapularis]
MSALLALVFVCATVAEGLEAGRSAEYVVYPRLLEARGVNGEKLLHIDEKLTLRLEKSSVVAENLVVSTLNVNGQVDTLVDGRGVEKDIYHDKSQMAAVSLTEKDGAVEVSGALGHTLRIAPLSLMGRSEDGQIAHKVFKIEEPAQYKTDYIVPTERNLWARPPLQQAAKIPEVFTVEMAFIFDPHHKKEFPNERSMLIYAATTTVLVNMRYEATSNPLVQFVLVAVLQGDFFARTVVAPDDLRKSSHKKTYMLSKDTLDNLAKAVHTGQINVKADLVTFVTKFDLASVEKGILSNAVLGVAFLGGMCTSHLRVAETEDTPHTFSLVPILVHEWGHSLGMVHDGDRARYSTQAYRNIICDANDGYTMAPVANGKRNGEWSVCSLEHLRGFVSTLSQVCFDRTAEKHYRINMTQLPGAALTKLELCRKTYKGFVDMTVHPNYLNARTCNVFCCPYKYGKCLEVPLMDGMECAYGYHCVKHKCIPKLAHQAPRRAPPNRVLPQSSTTTPTERTTTTYGPRPKTPRRRANNSRWWQYRSGYPRSTGAGQ